MAQRKKKEQAKARREKRKKKAQQRAARSSLPSRAETLGENVRVIPTPGGTEKMSEILMEFLAPYLESAATEDALRKLITVGMVAWNAAVLGTKAANLIADTASTLPPEAQSQFLQIVMEMMLRKQQHFAHIKRLLIDYELRLSASGFDINVVSTFPEGAGEP